MNTYVVKTYSIEYDNSITNVVEADYVDFEDDHVTFSRKSSDGGFDYYARYNNVISVVMED